MRIFSLWEITDPPPPYGPTKLAEGVEWSDGGVVVRSEKYKYNFTAVY